MGMPPFQIWDSLTGLEESFINSFSMHTTATLVQANLLFHLDSSPRLHESEIRSVVSNSLRPHGIFQARYTGVGSLSILQGIFPTQGSNPGLLYCTRILYHLSHKESPRILERVAYPFSRESSQPRNQTRVSCIAGMFFTS